MKALHESGCMKEVTLISDEERLRNEIVGKACVCNPREYLRIRFNVCQVSMLNCRLVDWQDGVLTKEEVLDKYEVFVGSQATDFGEALRKHDEF